MVVPVKQKRTASVADDDTMTTINSKDRELEQLLSDKLLEGYLLLDKACPACATPLVRREAEDEENEAPGPPHVQIEDRDEAPRSDSHSREASVPESSGSFDQPVQPITGVPYCVNCKAHVVVDPNEVVLLEADESCKKRGCILVALQSGELSQDYTGTETSGSVSNEGEDDDYDDEDSETSATTPTKPSEIDVAIENSLPSAVAVEKSSVRDPRILPTPRTSNYSSSRKMASVTRTINRTIIENSCFESEDVEVINYEEEVSQMIDKVEEGSQMNDKRPCSAPKCSVATEANEFDGEDFAKRKNIQRGAIELKVATSQLPSYEIRREIATKILSTKMIQGYQLVEFQCKKCRMPMMKAKTGEKACFVCPVLEKRAQKEKEREKQSFETVRRKQILLEQKRLIEQEVKTQRDQIIQRRTAIVNAVESSPSGYSGSYSIGASTISTKTDFMPGDFHSSERRRSQINNSTNRVRHPSSQVISENVNQELLQQNHQLDQKVNSEKTPEIVDEVYHTSDDLLNATTQIESKNVANDIDATKSADKYADSEAHSKENSSFPYIVETVIGNQGTAEEEIEQVVDKNSFSVSGSSRYNSLNQPVSPSRQQVVASATQVGKQIAASNAKPSTETNQSHDVKDEESAICNRSLVSNQTVSIATQTSVPPDHRDIEVLILATVAQSNSAEDCKKVPPQHAECSTIELSGEVDASSPTAKTSVPMKDNHQSNEEIITSNVDTWVQEGPTSEQMAGLRSAVSTGPTPTCVAQDWLTSSPFLAGEESNTTSSLSSLIFPHAQPPDFLKSTEDNYLPSNSNKSASTSQAPKPVDNREGICSQTDRSLENSCSTQMQRQRQQKMTTRIEKSLVVHQAPWSNSRASYAPLQSARSNPSTPHEILAETVQSHDGNQLDMGHNSNRSESFEVSEQTIQLTKDKISTYGPIDCSYVARETMEPVISLNSDLASLLPPSPRQRKQIEAEEARLKAEAEQAEFQRILAEKSIRLMKETAISQALEHERKRVSVETERLKHLQELRFAHERSTAGKRMATDMENKESSKIQGKMRFLQDEIRSAERARQEAEQEARRLADEKRAMEEANMLRRLEEEAAAKQKEAEEAMERARQALEQVEHAKKEIISKTIAEGEAEVIAEVERIVRAEAEDYHEKAAESSATSLEHQDHWETLRIEGRSVMTSNLMSGWTLLPELCMGKQCQNAPLLVKDQQKQCVVCRGSGNGEDGAYAAKIELEEEEADDAQLEVAQSVESRSFQYLSPESSMPSPKKTFNPIVWDQPSWNKQSRLEIRSVTEIHDDFSMKRDVVSKEIGKRMLKGWSLIDMSCPHCMMPLMTDLGGREVCVLCGIVSKIQGKPHLLDLQVQRKRTLSTESRVTDSSYDKDQLPTMQSVAEEQNLSHISDSQFSSAEFETNTEEREGTNGQEKVETEMERCLKNDNESSNEVQLTELQRDRQNFDEDLNKLHLVPSDKPTAILKKVESDGKFCTQTSKESSCAAEHSERSVNDLQSSSLWMRRKERYKNLVANSLSGMKPVKIAHQRGKEDEIVCESEGNNFSVNSKATDEESKKSKLEPGENLIDVIKSQSKLRSSARLTASWVNREPDSDDKDNQQILTTDTKETAPVSLPTFGSLLSDDSISITDMIASNLTTPAGRRSSLDPSPHASSKGLYSPLSILMRRGAEPLNSPPVDPIISPSGHASRTFTPRGDPPALQGNIFSRKKAIDVDGYVAGKRKMIKKTIGNKVTVEEKSSCTNSTASASASESDNDPGGDMLTLQIPKSLNLTDETSLRKLLEAAQMPTPKVDTENEGGRRAEPSPGMAAATMPETFPSPANCSGSEATSEELSQTRQTRQSRPKITPETLTRSRSLSNSRNQRKEVSSDSTVSSAPVPKNNARNGPPQRSALQKLGKTKNKVRALMAPRPDIILVKSPHDESSSGFNSSLSDDKLDALLSRLEAAKLELMNSGSLGSQKGVNPQERLRQLVESLAKAAEEMQQLDAEESSH